MKKINIKFIIEEAIVAALYVALTWLFAPISYGAIQFRISEVLMILVILNPKYGIALVLGCFIANTTSTLGWYDMVFGTLATFIAVIGMVFVRNIFIASIFPVISNGFIVAFELGLAFDMMHTYDFFYNVITVALGEAVVIFLLGIPLAISLVKNEYLVNVMELDSSIVKIKGNFFTLKNCLLMSLVTLGIILFIAYPISTIKADETTYVSSLSLLKDSKIYISISLLIIPIIYFIFNFIPNRIIKLILSTICSIAFIVMLFLVGSKTSNSLNSFYFYLYLIYPILIIIFSIYSFLKKDNINVNNLDTEAIA